MEIWEFVKLKGQEWVEMVGVLATPVAKINYKALTQIVIGHAYRGGGVIGEAITMPEGLGGTRGGVDGSISGAGDPGAGVVPSTGERIGDRGLV